MHVNDREQAILKKFLEYTGNEDQTKAPVIASFLRKYYFTDHARSSLGVRDQSRALFIDSSLSPKEWNREFCDCCEMIFLFEKLREEKYIHIVSVKAARLQGPDDRVIRFPAVKLEAQLDEVVRTVICAAVVVSQDLIDYVNDGFRTPEEKAAQENLAVAWRSLKVAKRGVKVAWVGVAVAIIVALVQAF